MISRIRKAIDEKDDKGFTLIELLVVIIIIGILAAIAIPLFLNQQKKAQDAATKADVSTIGKELATWYVDNSADPALTRSPNTTAKGAWQLNGDKISNASENVVLQGTPTYGKETWSVTLTNASGSKDFTYSAANGLQETPRTP